MPNHNDNELDKKLANAILGANIQDIEKFMRDGANPLAIIIMTSQNIPVQVFDLIFVHPNINVLNAILNTALQTYKKTGYNIIDLSRPLLDDPEYLNLFQFVCQCCGLVPFIDSVVKYAEATGQDVKTLLNTGVPNIDGSGTTTDFAVSLMKAFSRDIINANLYFTYSSKVECKAASQYWINSTVNNTKNNALLPEIDSPIKISFCGPIKTLEYLIEQGLEIADLCRRLPGYLAASQNPETWEDFKTILYFNRGVTPTSTARLAEDGRVCFDCYIHYPGKNKFPAIITLDYKPLNEMVQRKAKELADAKANGSAAITTLFAEQKKINATLNQVQELRLERIRGIIENERMTKVLDFFDSVYQGVKYRIQSRQLAATGVFTTKPTTEQAQMANVAVKVIKLIGDGVTAVPFATFVTSIVNELVDMRTEAYANTQNQGVKNATSGKNMERIAIDVATLLSCAAMQRYQENIPEDVTNEVVLLLTNQVDKLYEYQFKNEASLGYFLMQPALGYLSQQIRLQTTQSSSFSGNSPNKLMLVAAPNIYNKPSNDDIPTVKVVNSKKCCVVS